MDLDNYKKIKSILIEAEMLFPVEMWMVEDIHIWPILRNRIFMYVINDIEIQEKTKQKAIIRKQTKHKWLLFFIFMRNTFKYWFWIINIKQKDTLFVSSDTYRVNVDGKRFNRFYDPLILKQNKVDSSAVLEYHNDKKNHYFENLSIDFIDYLEVYENSLFKVYYTKLKKIKKSIPDYEKFLSYISTFDMTKNISELYSINQIENYHSKRWILHYNNAMKILNKIKPKEVYTLCYYNNQVMLLVAAAKKNGIKTIEMQHGPIASNHLAYGSWTKLPEDGYNTIPEIFWCWNSDSKKRIDSSLGEKSNYTAFVGGHPWIDYCKEKNNKIYDIGEKIILYTIQLEFPLDYFFNEKVSYLIKKSKYKWYVRLHPRQMSELKNIEMYLREKGLSEYVNIREATELPLPYLLTKSIINVTSNSGTTIEASMLNVFTVLLDSLSKSYYSEIIDQGLAEYMDVSSENFTSRFNDIVLDNLKK